MPSDATMLNGCATVAQAILLCYLAVEAKQSTLHGQADSPTSLHHVTLLLKPPLPRLCPAWQYPGLCMQLALKPVKGVDRMQEQNSQAGHVDLRQQQVLRAREENSGMRSSTA